MRLRDDLADGERRQFRPAIALETRKRGKAGAVRRPYLDVVPKRLAEYYELEDEAEMASKLEGEFVPGLIQTEAYARALIGAGEPTDEVDRLVEIRMDRKRLLKGDDPLHFRVALGELLSSRRSVVRR